VATTLRERLTTLVGGGERAGDRYVTTLGTFFYGCVLLLMAAILLAAVFEAWPTVDDVTLDASTNRETASLFFGLLDVSVDKSTGLLLVVMVMGALGGFIHTATSFATYAGNRTLRASWMWWFWLRIPLGATLALGFYFVLRAGLVGVQEGSQDINSYGTAALAFLSGAFSKQAVDKLEEVFNTLASVREGGDRRRMDGAEDRPPVIARLRPDRVEPHKDVELTVIGQRFRRGARVRLDDRLHKTSFEGEDRLVIELPAAQLDPGALRVAVVNPAPHDDQSNAMVLRVDER
jgi:hypothetical protein